MTPKEKAKELFDHYYQLAESIEWTDDETKVKAEQFNDELGSDVLKYWHLLAKESALIAVEFAREFITGDLNEKFDKFIYLQDIKEEIEKL